MAIEIVDLPSYKMVDLSIVLFYVYQARYIGKASGSPSNSALAKPSFRPTAPGLAWIKSWIELQKT